MRIVASSLGSIMAVASRRVRRPGVGEGAAKIEEEEEVGAFFFPYVFAFLGGISLSRGAILGTL